MKKPSQYSTARTFCFASAYIYARHLGVYRYLPIILYLFVLLCAGCATLPDKPDSVAYHELYRVIDDPEVLRFLESGLELLEQEHGPLEFPVNKVFVRLSSKNADGQTYRIAEGFSLTEVVDAEAGIFAIYVLAPPDHAEFYPLLAHEIGHLKQPSLVDDWDMEGFCMVFSEELCHQESKDWSAWKRHFRKHSNNPYARAYRAALARRNVG